MKFKLLKKMINLKEATKKVTQDVVKSITSGSNKVIPASEAKLACEQKMEALKEKINKHEENVMGTIIKGIMSSEKGEFRTNGYLSNSLLKKMSDLGYQYEQIVEFDQDYRILYEFKV